MLGDVGRFLLMYSIFLFAFSTIMVGAGGPRGAIDKCYTAGLAVPSGDDRRKSKSGPSGLDDSVGDMAARNSSGLLGGGEASSKQVPADQEDFEYVTCWQSWWFVRS